MTNVRRFGLVLVSLLASPVASRIPVKNEARAVLIRFPKALDRSAEDLVRTADASVFL
jgi:hypothetical protein